MLVFGLYKVTRYMDGFSYLFGMCVVNYCSIMCGGGSILEGTMRLNHDLLGDCS